MKCNLRNRIDAASHWSHLSHKCDQCDAGYVGTPVAICSYALMDIEARPRQCANTMIIDTQAGFRMTFAIVLAYCKNARTSLIVSLMRCYSLNNYDRV